MNNEIGSSASVRLRGLFLLAVVFVAGGVAGSAIDRIWISGLKAGVAQADVRALAPHTINDRMPVGGGVPGARDTVVEIPMSLRSVALTDAQHEKIVAIVRRLHPGVDSIMQSLRPQVVAIDLRMRQEAMCVLTQEQRDDWIAFRKREHLNVEEGNIMMKLVTNHECPPDR